MESLGGRRRLEGRRACDTDLLGDTGADVRVDGSEDGEGTLLDLVALGAAEVTGDVRDETLARGVVKDLLPELTRLLKVEFGDERELVDALAGELFVLREVVASRLVRERLDRRLVVRAVALVVERHGTVALEVRGRLERRIDRELGVVGAEAVTVSVRVRVQTRLQNRVRGRFDTRNEVRGRKGDLLDLGKVVLRVLVERELADRAKGELLVRPDLRIRRTSIHMGILPGFELIIKRTLVRSRML